MLNAVIYENAEKPSEDNGTNDLVRYGVQLAMLNSLLALNLLTSKEHYIIKENLMKDYKIAKNMT